MPTLEIQLDWDTPSLDAAFAELERELTGVARGITVKLWDSILFRTPQFAGGMAASWSYSLGAPQFYDRSGMVDPLPKAEFVSAAGPWEKPIPRSKGHLAAINIANDDNIGSEMAFKLGDTVYIANGVDHGEGPYSMDVETGVVRLRAINMPGAPVSRSLDMIKAKFDKDVSAHAAVQLKQFRIGRNNANSGS